MAFLELVLRKLQTEPLHWAAYIHRSHLSQKFTSLSSYPVADSILVTQEDSYLGVSKFILYKSAPKLLLSAYLRDDGSVFGCSGKDFWHQQCYGFTEQELPRTITVGWANLSWSQGQLICPEVHCKNIGSPGMSMDPGRAQQCRSITSVPLA